MPNADYTILRDLGRRVAEIAALPVQKETIAAWKALNSLKPIRPMATIDQVCWHEMNVNDELTLRCEDEFCKKIEKQLRRTIYRWKHMPADMVVEPVVEIDKAIVNTGLGLHIQEERAITDSGNDVVSHHYIDQLANEEDLAKIKDPQISHDEAATARREARAHEIFDGILRVRMQGFIPMFHPWDWIVMWRGGENVILDLADRPEYMHKMIDRVTEANLRMLDQLEAQGLLGTHQRLIHCTGAWTDEIDTESPAAMKSAKHLWTFGMSQIFSTVSPTMHEEFERPYLTRWFNRFGMIYYGCCEPLDFKVEMIRKLPKVRKVSMSPWTDQDRGAANLGKDYVFSRKPSPALLATERFDPADIERDLKTTLDTCKRHGCAVELIQKDISTVRYEPQRLWQWNDVAMKLVKG